MAKPPIIGTSGQYNNPRNQRQMRTTSGQGNQNIVNAVSNSYLLEDIAAGDTGLVRFVDPATEEIDFVMTPITAKNISQFDFDKSSIVTHFRLPGIATPMLLIGDANNPDQTGFVPPGVLAPSDFININGLYGPTTIDLTSDLGFFLHFEDTDPGGTGLGDYTVTLLNNDSSGDIGFVITPGDSGVIDTTPGTPPPHVFSLEGTLDEINALFSNQTTGTVTTTVNPGHIHTLTVGIIAPDGRSSSHTYYIYAEENVATLIDVATSIYVRTTGDNTTGDGSTGNPYLTVQKALETLIDKRIAGNVTVTIIVGDGAFAESQLSMSHRDGARIVITGENMPTTTVSSVQSSSGSAGAWAIILNVASIANIAVGDYIMMLAPTGGTLPTYLAGCHEVTNRDAVNTRITVTSKHLNATAPSGAVAGTIQIFKTRLTFASGDGLSCGPTISLGCLTKLVMVGAAGTTIGLAASTGQMALTNCGIVNWGTGLFPSRCGEITGSGIAISGCASAGIFAYTSGLFDNAATACVISGSLTGIVSTHKGQATFGSSIVTGCNVGVSTGTGGRTQLSSAKVTGCTSTGIQCFFAGAVYAAGVTSDRNATGIGADSGGTVYATSATITNNTSYGVFILYNSVVVIIGSTLTGNGTDSNVLYDVVQRDGANIINVALAGPELGVSYDKVLAADLPITNLQEQDTLLIFPVVAGETWLVELFGTASGNDGTGDGSINLMNTGTWVAARSNFQGTSYNGGATLTATAATAFNSATRMVASPGQAICQGAASSLAYPFRFTAEFTVDGSGNVKVVWGNASASAGRISTLRAGTRIQATKIAG